MISLRCSREASSHNPPRASRALPVSVAIRVWHVPHHPLCDDIQYIFQQMARTEVAASELSRGV